MKSIVKKVILLLISSLFYGCPGSIEVILKNNRTKISDNIEGVWEYGEGFFEIIKKDDYWAFFKAFNNEGDEFKCDLTFHEYGDYTLACISGWDKKGDRGGDLYCIGSLKNDTMVLYSIAITSKIDKKTFRGTPLKVREAVFESYIKDGKIGIDKNDKTIIKKKYEFLKR